jgi:O-antigen/teichoic acid export membrane protein
MSRSGDDSVTHGSEQTVDLKRILERAGRSAGAYLPVRFVPALTSLLTVPIFTRAIGPAEYGDFYLVVSATALLAHLAVTWITHSTVRYYWVYARQDRMGTMLSSTVWTALASLLLIAAASWGVVALAGDLVPDGITRLVPIALVSFLFNRFVVVLLEVLKAGNHARRYAAVSVTSTVVGTAVSIWLVVVTDLGALGIIAGNAVGFAIVTPWALRDVGKLGSLAPRLFESRVFKEYAGYGFPLAFASLSYWLLVLSDRYVIGVLRGSAEAGLYSVAYGLGEKLMQMFVLPLTMTMVPLLVEAFEKHGQGNAEAVQREFTRFYALVTVPLMVGLAVVSRDFMEVFTDSAYWEATAVLPIVAAGSFLYGLTEVAGIGIALHKRTMITMSNTFIAAAANIGANLVLVGRFGYMAAAYTTVGAYVLLIVLTWTRSRRYMRWSVPTRRLVPVFVAAGVMGAAVFGSTLVLPSGVLALLVEVVLGIVVFLIAGRLLGAVTAGESAFLVELVRRIVRAAGKGLGRRPSGEE